ncbi:helix-turn-helix domain-containing protein [Cellulomonas endophytica]|uniref:helix-turn-helix domain-containing protein n=1 Tax=Cellulomonas endophytica TaxID=2494735 RepID=UPI0010118BA6|nr:helix-turn-helix domain-containing protein [Cellulomonas endophytica]
MAVDDLTHTPRLMLTMTEAADRLSIGRTSLYQLVRTGEIESVHIGRLRRIPADGLLAFVERCRATAASHQS